MERKLRYTSTHFCRTLNSKYASGSTYCYVVTDGETFIKLDDCLIFETVFTIDEFDEIVASCQSNNGVDEAEGWEIVTRDQLPKDSNPNNWAPLFETEEDQEAYYDSDEWLEEAGIIAVED